MPFIAKSRPDALLRPDLRRRGTVAFRWLEKPASYAVGATVLSALGASTTLLVPMLLDPAAFGTFALLSMLFLCASSCDLGLAQLGDKTLAKYGVLSQDMVEELVQARWLIALGTGALLFLGAGLVAFAGGSLTPLDATLAIVAGLAMMIANGRVIAFRTTFRISAFAVSALTLQFGLTLPRLLGLLAAGVSGCFAVLVLWYGAAAMIMAKPCRMTRERIGMTGDLLWRGLPLFAFCGFWLVNTCASRWISAALSSQHDFGLFAFGANFGFVAITLISTIAQTRYPVIIQAIHRSQEVGSVLLARDIVRLAGALTIMVLFACLCGKAILAFVFPHFIDAHGAALVTAVSCIPLGIVAWVLPIVVAFSPKPLLDSCKLFVPTLAVLGASMVVGNAAGGIVGQAWGCVGTSVVLLAMLLLYMRRIGILAQPAFRSVSGTAVVLLIGAGASAAASSSGQPSKVADIEGMPPAGWSLAFNDDFDDLRLRNDLSGIWEPHYPWGARSNNKELEFYIDPRPGKDPTALAALNPFRIADGKLLIQANQIPLAHRAAAQGKSYSSGLLTTAPSFAFQYGYVEIRARVPAGQGLWPALWLIPVDQSWPPEIDIMEVLGHRTGEYWATLYGGEKTRPDKTTSRVQTPDLAADFHSFGVKWTASDVTWFFDGSAVARARTPANGHKPMYIVVNLAVGGDWPGAPDGTTSFPTEFAVDYVRVYTPPTAIQKEETER